jgi:hypothetical protein
MVTQTLREATEAGLLTPMEETPLATLGMVLMEVVPPLTLEPQTLVLAPAF